MGRARLTVHAADARPWLDRSDARFDAIAIDAYRQPYIPFQLVTEEFFRSVQDHLTPGGAVMINVGAPPGENAALDRIAGTMAAVFPGVEQAPANEFNTVVWAFRDGEPKAGAVPEPLQPVCSALENDAKRVAPIDDPLTDDHAPIEWLTDTALLSYLREGAPGAER